MSVPTAVMPLISHLAEAASRTSSAQQIEALRLSLSATGLAENDTEGTARAIFARIENLERENEELAELLTSESMGRLHAQLRAAQDGQEQLKTALARLYLLTTLAELI